MPSPLPPQAERVFRSELFTIYTWPQELYDGSTKIFECCVRPDTAVVMGFVNVDTILLTKQEQPHRAHAFFDLPGGRIEGGEDPEIAARREFLEETGYEIGRIEHWFTDTQRGIVRFSQHFFWATDLRSHPTKQHLDSGERITLLSVSLTEFRRYCLHNLLRNRLTALAWLQLGEDLSMQERLHTFLR